MKKLLLLSSFLCFGCLTVGSAEDYWNVPSTGTSVFDGSKYIKVSNIACNDVFFELYQDDYKASRNKVLLKAGLRSIENIDSGASLLFNVDGKKYSFSSSDPTTEYGEADIHGVQDHGVPYSYKKYVLFESFVRKIANAQNVTTKLILLKGTYLEGKCSNLTYDEKLAITDAEYKSYVTPENMEEVNKVSGVNGFKKFVSMMDNL